MSSRRSSRQFLRQVLLSNILQQVTVRDQRTEVYRTYNDEDLGVGVVRMDQLGKYINILIAERNRVDAEITRLEGLGHGSKARIPAPRRKTVSRKATASREAGPDAAPSSRRSSDRP